MAVGLSQKVSFEDFQSLSEGIVIADDAIASPVDINGFLFDVGAAETIAQRIGRFNLDRVVVSSIPGDAEDRAASYFEYELGLDTEIPAWAIPGYVRRAYPPFRGALILAKDEESTDPHSELRITVINARKNFTLSDRRGLGRPESPSDAKLQASFLNSAVKATVAAGLIAARRGLTTQSIVPGRMMAFIGQRAFPDLISIAERH